MSNSSPPSPQARQLARQARERYVAQACRSLAGMGDAVYEKLTALMDQPTNLREMQDRRDYWMAFQQKRQAWLDATAAAWQDALNSPVDRSTPKPAQDLAGGLSLVGDEVMEDRILAARLGSAAMEKAAEFEDMRIRIEHLEREELAATDVLRPDTFALALVQQWATKGLPREVLGVMADAVQGVFAKNCVEGFRAANVFLVQNGVLPTIDLQTRVRRPAGGESVRSPLGSDPRNTARDSGGDAVPDSSASWARGVPPSARTRQAGMGAHEETRMLTGATPLTRARMRAQGVLGTLKRLLIDHIADFDSGRKPEPPSPELMRALAPPATPSARAGVHIGDTQLAGVAGAGGGDYGGGHADVAMVSEEIRARTTELKKKASTDTEKATIEVVALMFQAILAEERIPPSIRVWFARLQLPVLRVALAEPEFFGTMDHPARQLIDRMGSVVMGFDTSSINGSALEVEIRRVVQVIEQYPETGRRVFQLVYEEFQKFLAKFLTEGEVAQKVVSVAQQVEQKETLAIQYTIEMRAQLKDMPVRGEIRDFLFKVWAEVLAMAAIRHGPQHEETLAYKRTAPTLVWAASAKPNRADRTKVIQDLPDLLARLHRGMTLLGLPQGTQDAHIKVIKDTLTDAFLSKTEVIPQARIEAMAKRLENLEDFLTDDGTGDMPLDAETIELMLGIDASLINIITDGGSKPTEAMTAWAHELQPGHWFTLEHNGKVQEVQYSWRSERRQLHLFAARTGSTFLIQIGRLASYLQAGLLLPREEEALTLRATREALAKLDANPERLLA